MDMIKKIAEFTPDNLIAGTYPPAVVNVVKVTTPVVRGQVVTGAAGSALAVATGALSASNVAFVVASDASTGEAAEVYISGEFNRQVVSDITGYDLTEADVEVLREKNIILTSEADYEVAATDEDEEDDNNG